MILNGLRFFSESFFEGQVEWKYLALTKTELPTSKVGMGKRQGSVGPWYRS
jgi:hypothetical protein